MKKLLSLEKFLLGDQDLSTLKIWHSILTNMALASSGKIYQGLLKGMFKRDFIIPGRFLTSWFQF